MRNGVGIAVQRLQGDAQIVVRLRVIGRERQGDLEALDGLLWTTERGQRIAEPNVCVGIVGLVCERGLERACRLLMPIESSEQFAERQLRIDELRSRRNGLLVLRNRVGVAAERLQHGREIVVRLREAGLERDGAFVMLNGLVVTIERRQRVGEIEMGFGTMRL